MRRFVIFCLRNVSLIRKSMAEDGLVFGIGIGLFILILLWSVVVFVGIITLRWNNGGILTVSLVSLATLVTIILVFIPRAIMDDLNKELSNIKVTKPVVKVTKTPPASYTSNDNKEIEILGYAENFRRQFVHLYRDRKPLFLSPPNEHNIEMSPKHCVAPLQKIVCTTLRPTLLPYKELYDWDGCAQFVSDYLTYTPLECPNELPEVLSSPTEVLAQQKGNCFDFSTLLCSLLLGAGYDAYCVCGYAAREVTLMDQSRSECPLLKKGDAVVKEAGKTKESKYDVKPPRDLRSKYLIKMEERKVQERLDEEQRIKDIELGKIAELEKPAPDELYGMRVHCWVLVLAGKREVPENFFIEPSTGTSVEVGDYLGIESLWNSTNYWVNMQDCSHGISEMSFDLGDIARWEFMFPHNEKPLLALPGEEDFDMAPLEEEEEEAEEETSMPTSWVEEIVLPLEVWCGKTWSSKATENIQVLFKTAEISESFISSDLQRRCPQGKKTVLYKQAKYEIFAEYLMADGMIARLTEYSDSAREYEIGEGQCSARTDGLKCREETPTVLTEHYKDRDDFLEKRIVNYTKRVKKFGPAEGNEKPINQITEYYARDTSLAADDDIAELTFLLNEEKMFIKHHLQDERIISSTHEYLKPFPGTFFNRNRLNQEILVPDWLITSHVI
eukprot:sb/3462738/